jgi:hypothetical protein
MNNKSPEKCVLNLNEHNVPFIVRPLQTPVCHMAIHDPDGNNPIVHRHNAD